MIKDQIRRASGRLVALIVVAVLLTALAVAQVRFGGPIQRKHALQDEMLADILPPPAYVVEPYLLATLAAEDPRQAAPALADMARLKAEFEQRKAYWAGAAVPETVRPQLGRVIATADVFWNAVDSRFAPAVRAGDAEQVRRIHRTVLAPIYDRQHQDVVALVALSRQVSEAAMVRDRWTVGILLALSALAGLGVVGSILWAARVLQQRMIAPLSQNVRLIGSLAGGSYDMAIDGLSRTDEFGSMARAMEVFRKSGIAKREADAAQQAVVRALTSGLRKLAEKDLEYRIEDEDFPAAYEQLRENFNSALEALAGGDGHGARRGGQRDACDRRDPGRLGRSCRAQPAAGGQPRRDGGSDEPRERPGASVCRDRGRCPGSDIRRASPGQRGRRGGA
ncbi:HAMP domain-containing protein [Novosphingobium colocasiae]